MADDTDPDGLLVRCREVVERTTVYRLCRAVKWHAIEVAVICLATWEQRRDKR